MPAFREGAAQDENGNAIRGLNRLPAGTPFFIFGIVAVPVQALRGTVEAGFLWAPGATYQIFRALGRDWESRPGLDTRLENGEGG